MLKSILPLFFALFLSLPAKAADGSQFTLPDGPDLWQPPYQNHLSMASACGYLKKLADRAQFKKPINLAQQADFVVLDKSRRLLHLMKENQILRTYNTALGKQPVGKKRQDGDNKTPEGLYFIGYKNSGSSFHLSLEITYPNQDDINWARKNKVNPGGDIMIHGLPNEDFKKWFINHPKSNWTRGCVAVTDDEIEEIWSMVKTGTAIELCP